MKYDANYVCPICARPPEPEVQDSDELMRDEGDRLNIVHKFCYLGDLTGAGAEGTSRTRIRCGWKTFNNIAPVLTLRGASHKL